MSDVLTPSEVDALLEGVSNGDLGKGPEVFPEGAVTPYDLTATDHIMRSDIPSMDILNQGLARNLRTSFKTLLKGDIRVSVGDVIEQKFADFTATLPEPTLLCLIRLPDLNSQAIFVLSAELIKNYVDIYFGGGNKALAPTPREGFTRTETRVAKQILDVVLRDFEAAWRPIVPITGAVTKSETSPQFCKFIESTESIVVSKFKLQLSKEDYSTEDLEEAGAAEAKEADATEAKDTEEAEQDDTGENETEDTGESEDSEESEPEKETLSRGSYFCCVLLSSTLSPLYEKMDAGNRGSQSEDRSAWTTTMKSRIKDIELPLRTPIASKSFSLGKLVRLQPGDIIPIELKPKVSLKAGEVELFRGKFGLSNNKNSLRIEDVV